MSYHSIFELVEDTNDHMQRLLNDQFDMVPASDLGLDRRAANRVFVNEDAIVITKAGDRSLQYYGGFEYVDPEYRSEMGDYVIYSGDDDRVRGHIAHYYEEEHDTVDE